MDTDQNYTGWEIASDKQQEETQDDSFSVFFFELLSEQRY